MFIKAIIKHTFKMMVDGFISELVGVLNILALENVVTTLLVVIVFIAAG